MACVECLATRLVRPSQHRRCNFTVIGKRTTDGIKIGPHDSLVQITDAVSRIELILAVKMSSLATQRVESVRKSGVVKIRVQEGVQ